MYEIVWEFQPAPRREGDFEAVCDLYSDRYKEELAIGENCPAFVEEQTTGAGGGELSVADVRASSGCAGLPGSRYPTRYPIRPDARNSKPHAGASAPQGRDLLLIPSAPLAPGAPQAGLRPPPGWPTGKVEGTAQLSSHYSTLVDPMSAVRSGVYRCTSAHQLLRSRSSRHDVCALP